MMTMRGCGGSLAFKPQCLDAGARPRDGDNHHPKNSNRLAPYNPTHATAQAKALDLLRLTSRDVFFDLGCGDGRMVVAALERCYDDDFLLRIHQERFARLRLAPLPREQDHEGDPRPPPRLQLQRQEVHRGVDRPDSWRTQSLDRDAPPTPTINPASIKSIRHSRTNSDYSIPHLMREGDETSEFESTVDHTTTPRQRNDNTAGAESPPSHSESSPPLTQQQGGLTPTTPDTPVANNLRVISAREVSISPQLPLPSPAEPRSVNRQQQSAVGDNGHPRQGQGIPKTIETPAPSEDRPHHAHNISELPMIESYSEDVLDAPVVSKHASIDDGGRGFAANGPVGEDAVGHGLRCVGIEYNQALAESAQSNLRKTHIYAHVERNVCIRWGDVMDEGNPAREGGRHPQKRGVGSIPTLADDDEDDDSNDDRRDANNLTLLRDATAVFVYLLPQGLAQVKPLLHAAARRRHGREGSRGGEFRVASYMFSIPGWKPTKVDQSSKGGCSVFLYENIHEEAG